MEFTSPLLRLTAKGFNCLPVTDSGILEFYVSS